MATVTIFTPTYNRAYTLPKLYASLCRQTSMDFEWLIVDDGSTDNTKTLVREWQREAPFSMLYFWQPNGGKMRAHNRGVQLCRTPYFICIDSDDFADEHCVEQILSQQSFMDQHEKVIGIIAHKAIRQKDGQYRVTKHFPITGICNLSTLHKNGYRGELALLFKTALLRRFPFPEIEGEKFISEGYIYAQIDQEFQYLIMIETWNYCQYMDDGYTHNARRFLHENPKGYALLFLQLSQFCRKKWSFENIGYILRYFIFSRLSGLRPSHKEVGLSPSLYKVLWILSYIVAVLFNYPRR